MALPPELVERVLLLVDQRQRLQNCACVCRNWRAPANTVTTGIQLSGASWEKASALSWWLQLFGNRVCSLQVDGPEFVMWHPLDCAKLTLPTARLTQLESLSCSMLQLQLQDSTVAGMPVRSCDEQPPQEAAAAIPHFTSLHLSCCTVHLGSSAHLLCGLTSLRSLCVELTNFCPSPDFPSALLASALPQLVQLTHLSFRGGLQGRELSDTALGGVSALQQLRELRLEGLHEVTADGLKSLPASLTLLRVLRAERVSISRSTTPAFTLLTGLVCLELGHIKQLEPAVLSGMIQLTRLSVRRVNAVAAAGSTAQGFGISTLQQLQELQLKWVPEMTAASMASLPGSLTLLEVKGAWPVTISSSTTPAFTQLTGLKCLKLDPIEQLEPALLLGMVQLRQLLFGSCCLLPGGAASVQALLAALAGMMEMQDLQLRPKFEGQAPAAAFSALTVSSKLTRLFVGYDDDEGFSTGDETGEPVPWAACGHMFVAGRQLLCLQELGLKLSDISAAEAMQAASPQAQTGGTPALAATEGETVSLPASEAGAQGPAPAQQVINSISECCPALHDLHLLMRQQSGCAVQLCSLLACTCLTGLQLRGKWRVDSDAWGVLAQLTALEDLFVECADGLTRAELLPLINLKQLRWLSLWEFGGQSDEEDASCPGDVKLHSKVRGFHVQLKVQRSAGDVCSSMFLQWFAVPHSVDM